MPTLIDFDKQTLKFFDSLQENLKEYIQLKNKLEKIETIAGADVDYKDNLARACICVLDYKNLKVLEKVIIEDKITFPYIPGYLLFREAPIILKAISKLKIKPDCFLFDGNGILHPRNMGLATFLGIVLEKPTIGCTKNLLLGKYKSLRKERGNSSCIRYKNRTLGAALRTKKEVKEIYLSVGWGITLKKAIKVVLDTSQYRIPQSLRLAHIYSKC